MNINMPIVDFTDGVKALERAMKRAGVKDPGMSADGWDIDPPLNEKEATLLRRCGWVRVEDTEVNRVYWTTKAHRDRPLPRTITSPRSDLEAAVRLWYLKGDRGTSSEMIASVGCHDIGWTKEVMNSCFGMTFPRDASDVARCVRLLTAVPDLAPIALTILGGNHKGWAKFVEHWEEIALLTIAAMEEEAANNSLPVRQRKIEAIEKLVSFLRPIVQDAEEATNTL